MKTECERTKELGKEGLSQGEEDVTCGKLDNCGVELSRRQHRKSAFPEGSYIMPSQDDMARKQIIEAMDALNSAEIWDFFSQVLQLELRKPLQDHLRLIQLSTSQE